MVHNIEFNRKFSCNNYKSKKLLLADMTFSDLMLNKERGDLYPCVCSYGSYREACDNGTYLFKADGNAASCARLIGAFNPYSTYDICVSDLSDGSEIGFLIKWDKSLTVFARRGGASVELFCRYEDTVTALGNATYEKDMHFLFTFHGGVFVEAYSKRDDYIKHIGDARIDGCACLIEEDTFSSAIAALYVRSDSGVRIRSAENYLDCGIMQADIKPVKYENGEALVEDGKIFFTYTSRFEAEMMQQVASYRLSTGELELVGALLFDYGDGKWCGDVASTLIYDRSAKKWRLWMCTFSHGHALAYAETENDIRYGINVVDVALPPKTDDAKKFGRMRGDEDPDLYYDGASGYWYLSICRNDTEIHKYRYYLFKSKKPNKDFEFVSYTKDSVEVTGGSFVRFGEKIYFVFGRSFSETAKYDCYSFPSLEKLGELKCNYSDGGFRGWGSVIEIPCGTRKRLLWATFDRTRGSEYNWSYGNLYFYESKSFKE